MKVFLGGTCNGSKWRDVFIPMLKEIGFDYFHPVVGDWNEEAQQREIEERRKVDFCLYVITPKMQGVYSIAEAVDDSNKRPEKTIFCLLTTPAFEEELFTCSQVNSLRAVGYLIERNGGQFFESLEDVKEYLGTLFC